ncbi:MAG TPA: DUF1697 domain-containing protein [Pyrinomonadaceae bacterium]|nr:DUF1697 domain-containing protein [Pyrinomonadaceae bacterium]
MARYVALLRGINVGGHKLIKMEALAQILTGAGLKNVRTYIASGNVVFESASVSSAALTRKIEKALKQALGYEVRAIIRTLPELEELVNLNPFRKYKAGPDLMLCVVFLAGEPQSMKLPLVSIAENLEVIGVAEGAAFTVSRRKKNGWFGFPNNFVEKQFGVTGTTRQWSSVQKILQFAQK